MLFIIIGVVFVAVLIFAVVGKTGPSGKTPQERAQNVMRMCSIPEDESLIWNSEKIYLAVTLHHIYFLSFGENGREIKLPLANVQRYEKLNRRDAWPLARIYETNGVSTDFAIHPNEVNGFFEALEFTGV